jgi:hypothetical protein
MKIVEIIGGLGNQMFQYALALSLKRAFPGESVKIDVSQYSAYRLHNGFELENIFGLKVDHASMQEIRALKFVFPSYLFSRFYRRLPSCFQKKTTCVEAQDMRWDASVLTRPGDRYFSGYWQNHRYFDSAREDILETYNFPEFTDDRSREISAEMLNNPLSVGIHVRLGDYMKDPLFRGICTRKYFANALSCLPGGMAGRRFYLFSNDRTLCEKELLPLLPRGSVVFVDWNRGRQSFRDMQLMTFCSSLILSNSTFSWWAAYLNRCKKPLVIVPEKWLNIRLAVPLILPEWKPVPSQ